MAHLLLLKFPPWADLVRALGASSFCWDDTKKKILSVTCSPSNILDPFSCSICFSSPYLYFFPKQFLAISMSIARHGIPWNMGTEVVVIFVGLSISPSIGIPGRQETVFSSLSHCPFSCAHGGKITQGFWK